MNEVSAIDIFGPDESYDVRLTRELDRQRVQREARRQLEAEERGAVTFPEFVTLREHLSRPRVRTEWRIDGWLQVGGRMMLTAQFKAGKTTFIGNMVRSFVDADLFLGHARVRPVDGAVVIVDTEMGSGQGLDWWQVQGIEQDQAIIPLHLRGQVAAFNILDRDNRAQWVSLLRQHQAEIVILDCMRPVLDALGLDEHRDAGRFLVAFDALLLEAGVSEGVVVQHMGHVNERARGDSRLRDWPDCEVRLVRQDEDPASPRFVSAYGRDVDLPESALTYDPVNRHLTIAGGSRKDAKAVELLDVVEDYLREQIEPLSGRKIEAALVEVGYPRDQIRAALHAGVKAGTILQTAGPRRSILHSIRECAAVREECAPRAVSECAAAYIEPRTHTLTGEDRTVPFSRALTGGAA